MFKKIISGVLLLSSATAFSGTMGVVEPMPDFNGFYVGLGSGVTTVSIQGNTSSVDSNGFLNYNNSARQLNDAILFTGNMGYGKMFAEKTYLGAKASVYYTPGEDTINGTNVYTNGVYSAVSSSLFRGTLLPTYNVDLMLGYEIIPHFLPFVEAGVTFSDVRVKASQVTTRSNLSLGTSINYTSLQNTLGYNTNYNVGVGGYYLVHKNWFFSTELVYTDMGKRSSSVAIPSHIAFDGVSETQTLASTSNALNLLFGVNYLFSL